MKSHVAIFLAAYNVGFKSCGGFSGGIFSNRLFFLFLWCFVFRICLCNSLSLMFFVFVDQVVSFFLLVSSSLLP